MLKLFLFLLFKSYVIIEILKNLFLSAFCIETIVMNYELIQLSDTKTGGLFTVYFIVLYCPLSKELRVVYIPPFGPHNKPVSYMRLGDGDWLRKI